MSEFRKGKSGILSQTLLTKIDSKIRDSLPVDSSITLEHMQQWRSNKPIPYKQRLHIEDFLLKTLPTQQDIQKHHQNDYEKLHECSSFIFLHRFEAMAKYYPNNTAIIFKDQIFTYEQVNEKANQIARNLIMHEHIKKGDIIGTFLPREPEWIITILAIWKAGGTFVAIDPTAIGSTPDAIDEYFEKFAQTISDAKPVLIVTRSDHQYLLPKSSESNTFSCLCLDDRFDIIDSMPLTNLDNELKPDDLAYILYTSGSSGKPKGVEITQRGLIPCLEAHRECVDLTHESIMAQYATCDFDAWVAEMLILGIGGALAIVPSEIRLDEKACAAYYQRHNISIVIFTPAFLNKLGGPENFRSWRALFIVGESFEWEDAKKWFNSNPSLEIVNGYGLVETTICTTLENLDFSESQKPLSIGKAIFGTEIVIKKPTNLDCIEYGENVQYFPDEVIDQEGEIWVKGISLTAGYRGDAKKENAWRFVDIHNNIKAIIDTETFYKTGDKAIMHADKRLEHLGRYSRMVKISGQRIELPSIEKNLCSKFNLEKMNLAVDAVGSSLEDKTLTTILVFIVKDKDKIINENEIREAIVTIEKNIDRKKQLVIIFRDEKLPTTHSKINYKQLKISYFESTKKNEFLEIERSINDILPSYEELIYQALRNIWKEILPKSDPKLHDSFFVLGGRSIDISALTNKVQLQYPEIQNYINNPWVFECNTLFAQVKSIYNLRNPCDINLLSKKIDMDAPYIVFCPPSILGNSKHDYSYIAEKLDGNFQLYGLNARGLDDPSHMPTTIYSMAMDYALAIKQWCEKNNKLSAPVFILGWSSGGILAPEIVNALSTCKISAYAYVCDSIAPFPFHHFTPEDHARELVFLATMLSERLNLKLNVEELTACLINKQKHRDRIEACFDYLISLSSKEDHNIILTAKIIRLAEHNYILRNSLKPFKLYKAQDNLFKNVLPTDEKHHWPKKYIANPNEPNFKANHFELIRNAFLAEKLSTQIKRDYATHKFLDLAGLLEAQEKYVVLNIKIISENGIKDSVSRGITRFLNSPVKKVLLIQGESGMGKTITSEYIFNTLIESKVSTKRLLLNRYSCEELRRGINQEIQSWKTQSCEMRVLFLDGYDERSGNIDFNYYETNGLSDFENIKFIWTCRSESLKPGYHSNFITSNRDEFEEWKLQNLTGIQIKELIKIELKSENKNNKNITPADIQLIAENYYTDIQQRRELYEITKNPLLLKFVLRGLAKLTASKNKITRYKIYQEFIKDYFERGEQKLKGQVGITQEDQPFQEQCNILCQEVAIAFFSEDITSFKYTPAPKKSLLITKKREQVSEKEKTSHARLNALFCTENRIILNACPVNSQENVYQFKHKSILEFFVVDALVALFINAENEAVDIQEWLQDKNFSPQLLVKNEAIVRFWQEAYQVNPSLRTRLASILYQTREDKTLGPIAAIAFTLLNLAEEPFIGDLSDLSGISVPYAIVDYANFDGTNLSNSDLSHVSLKGAWLRHTNLADCNMSGVKLGQNPMYKLKSPANSIQHSPNGELLVIADSENILFFNRESRKLQNKFNIKNGKILAIGYNNAGKWLALQVDQIKATVLFERKDRQKQYLFRNKAIILAAAFHPEGNLLAAANKDKSIQFWNITNGEKVHAIRGHTDWVNSVNFSSDGTMLVSGSGDKLIKLWDVGTFSCIVTFEGHMHWVNQVVFSPNNLYLASCSKDQTARIWNLQTKTCQQILKGHTANIKTVAFNPTSTQIATGSKDKTVRLWNIDGTCLKIFTGHINTVQGVSFSPDSAQIASAGNLLDRWVRLWDLNAGDLHLTYQKNNIQMLGVALSPDGERVVTSNSNYSIQIWNLSTAQNEITMIGHTDELLCVNYSASNHLVASGSRDKTIRFWNTTTGECESIIDQMINPITKIVFNHNNNYFATCSKGTAIDIWDMEKKICQHSITGHTNKISTIVYNHDSTLFASGSYDCTVCLWDVTKNYNYLYQLVGHKSVINSVAFNHDGTLIVTGSSDNTVRIWDIKTARCIVTCTEPTNSVFTVMFTPDGQHIAAGAGATLFFWNIHSNTCVNRIYFPSLVNTLSMSLDKQTQRLRLIAECSNSFHFFAEKKPKTYEFTLHWRTSNVLHASNAQMHNVVGLSQNNATLFRQLRADGLPERPSSNKDFVQKSSPTLEGQKFK